MTGIDTNVLVRYLVEDDLEQTRRPREFLDGVCTERTPGYLATAVLCEVTRLLLRSYRYDRRQVAQTIKRLLTANNLVVQDAAVAWVALGDFEAGKADYADYLIVHGNSYRECSHTVTFDRKAATYPLFKLLE